jgi:tetratricopeptide (TPR) repeat protein
VLFRYANFYLWPQGRIEEATAVIERTLSVDPLWVLANWALAYYLYARRQFDPAIRRLHAVIEMEPSFYLAYSVLGLAQVQQGRLEEAVRTFEKACELCPGNDFTLGMLAYGLGRSGKLEETHKLIEKITATGKNTFMPAKSLMFAYAGLNDAPNTLAWAAQSLSDRDPMTVMLLIQDPVLDFIRSDPWYPALFRKINLPQRI